MPASTTLLSLPSSLLVLLLTATLPAEALHASNPQINTTAELDQGQSPWEDIIRHDASIKRRLQLEQPTAVRKMTDDEGEKFWMDYWHFSEGRQYHRRDADSSLRDVRRKGRGHQVNNSSLLQPAYPVHLMERSTLDFSLFGRDVSIPRHLAIPTKRFFSSSSLLKRDFQCPANTRSCTSISRPNSCCALGTTCQIIPDTGLGDVGCCPGGSSSSNKCSGELDGCPDGHADCAEFPGGGCCIPGYTCVKDGCLFISTRTVTITASTSSIPPSSTRVATTTTTTQINPPIRPTSNPILTTTATISPSPSPTPTSDIPDSDHCPTGFYACNAAYQAGGCCRTGRDCNPTSCPPLTPHTTINTNGVTIIINAPASATATDQPASRCAKGWATCNPEAGGGCCPDGFRCGRESCTLSATSTATGTVAAGNDSGGGGGGGEEVVGKVPPESSAGHRVRPHGIIYLRAVVEPRYYPYFWIVVGILGLVVGCLF